MTIKPSDRRCIVHWCCSPSGPTSRCSEAAGWIHIQHGWVYMPWAQHPIKHKGLGHLKTSVIYHENSEYVGLGGPFSLVRHAFIIFFHYCFFEDKKGGPKMNQKKCGWPRWKALMLIANANQSDQNPLKVGTRWAPTSCKWGDGTPVRRFFSPQLPMYFRLLIGVVTPLSTIIGAHLGVHPTIYVIEVVEHFKWTSSNKTGPTIRLFTPDAAVLHCVRILAASWIFPK